VRVPIDGHGRNAEPQVDLVLVVPVRRMDDRRFEFLLALEEVLGQRWPLVR
jgi:hypothetical protein